MVTRDGVMDSLLLQPDGVGIAEIVLGREAVGRIDEEPEAEREPGKRDHGAPRGNAPPKSRDADQQHQRIERQQIARKQRASEDGEEQRVRDEDAGERCDEIARQSRACAAVRHCTWDQEQRCAGAQHRHE